MVLMGDLLLRIQHLVETGEYRISDHGYDELSQDGILVTEVTRGLKDAQIVEEYPHYAKGPCVLVLEWDSSRGPVHALWGIPAGSYSPAVLVTAYRPDPGRWTSDFLQRKQS